MNLKFLRNIFLTYYKLQMEVCCLCHKVLTFFINWQSLFGACKYRNLNMVKNNVNVNKAHANQCTTNTYDISHS